MRYLEEEEGFRVTYLPADGQGRVRLDALKEALCPETILVSVMYVNNEVGTVQPVRRRLRSQRGIIPRFCSTRCGTGIWKIPNLSEEDGDRSALRERT